MAKIKRVPAETKIEIVKAHLLDKKPVSELSEAHGISPKIYIFGKINYFPMVHWCLREKTTVVLVKMPLNGMSQKLKS